MFYRKFRSRILRNKVIIPLDRLLIGVSGGIDSMTLLHLLIRLQEEIPFSLAVAHVNYGLRGKESDGEEKLVRNFCAEKKIGCHVTRAPGGVGLKSDPPGNFQAAARDFRYHYFTEVAQSIGANKVATAHHQDDQVETILGNWLRGAGLHGLSGMRERRPLAAGIQLIRPLLAFSKEELLQFAKQEEVLFLDDSSNASNIYSRNRLREELLPVIKSLREGALEKITQVAEDLRAVADDLAAEADQWLKQYGRRGEDSFWFPRPALLRLPEVLQKEILHQALSLFIGPCQNLVRDHIVRCRQIVAEGEPQGRYHLPNGFLFLRSGEDLKITKN